MTVYLLYTEQWIACALQGPVCTSFSQRFKTGQCIEWWKCTVTN